MTNCHPTEHNPRYDGGGVYRCGECGEEFIMESALSALIDELELKHKPPKAKLEEMLSK